MIWYFNKYGLSTAGIDFILSVLKTGAIAILAYVGLKLANYHVPGDSQYFEIFTAIVVVGRAVVTFLSTWLKTNGPLLEASPADTVVTAEVSEPVSTEEVAAA